MIFRSTKIKSLKLGGSLASNESPKLGRRFSWHFNATSLLRPFKRLPKRLKIILVIILLIIGGLWFNQHLAIKIVALNFSQLWCGDKSEIEKAIQLQGQNLMLLNTVPVGQRLVDKFLCLNSVQFTKIYPSRITVDLEGRLPVALIRPVTVPELSLDYSTLEATPSSSAALINWQYQSSTEQWFYVDQTGLVFTTADLGHPYPNFQIEQPNLNVGSRLNDQVIQNAIWIAEQLANEEIVPQSYLITATNNLLINAGSVKLAFNLEQDVEKQIASLHLILREAKIDAKELLNVDLRFAKPVVIYSNSKAKSS